MVDVEGYFVGTFAAAKENGNLMFIANSYYKSGSFHCKNIFVVDGSYEKWLQKLMRTTVD